MVTGIKAFFTMPSTKTIKGLEDQLSKIENPDVQGKEAYNTKINEIAAAYKGRKEGFSKFARDLAGLTLFAGLATGLSFVKQLPAVMRSNPVRFGAAIATATLGTGAVLAKNAQHRNITAEAETGKKIKV